MSDDAKTINDAITDPAPTMPPPESVFIDLIKGFPGVLREAEVRELNGEDEEYLAGVESKANISYGEWLTAVLKRSVVHVGGEPPADLNGLINADRDLLMLATMRATYGPTKSVNVNCPHCKLSNEVEIDLADDFPVTLPAFDIDQPIIVSTRKRGNLYFSVPTGADTTAAAASKTVPEGNTIIISRCAVFPDGNEPASRLEWAKKLDADSRRKATDALLSIEIGPRLEVVETHCAHCEELITIGLNWVSLLFG